MIKKAYFCKYFNGDYEDIDKFIYLDRKKAAKRLRLLNKHVNYGCYRLEEKILI